MNDIMVDYKRNFQITINIPFLQLKRDIWVYLHSHMKHLENKLDIK